MNRNIAAVIDIGLGEVAALGQRRQHLLRHRAGHGRHGRDEMLPKGPDRLGHAPGDGALQGGHRLADRLAQEAELGGELGQDGGKALPSLIIGRRDLGGGAEGLDDEVDGAMIQMQAAIGEPGALGGQCRLELKYRTAFY